MYRRHHGWGVVWLGKAALAGTQRRAGSKRSRAKMGTWCERRRNVAKGFAAGRATLRADEIGANPMTPDFTMWIYTLNGGARHKGHNALPSVAARSLSGREP